MLAMSLHGVWQCLAGIVQPAWVSLFSHEKICHTEAVLKFVLPLLQAVSKSLVKVDSLLTLLSLFL